MIFKNHKHERGEATLYWLVGVVVVVLMLVQFLPMIQTSNLDKAMIELQQGGYVVLGTTAEYDTLTSSIAVVNVTSNHIIRDVETLEQHIHGKEYWWGKAAVQTATSWGSITVFTPHRATSGNGTFGAETKIIGSADTPVRLGILSEDFHSLMINAMSSATPYRMKIVWGGGTSAQALAADNISETMFQGASPVAQTQSFAIPVMMPRIPVGTQVWVFVANATNLATVDFFLGMHGYYDEVHDDEGE